MIKGKDVKAVPRVDDIPPEWRLASIEEIKGSGHSTYTRAVLDAIRKTPTKREYCQAQPKPQPQLGCAGIIIKISNRPATRPKKYNPVRNQLAYENKSW